MRTQAAIQRALAWVTVAVLVSTGCAGGANQGAVDVPPGPAAGAARPVDRAPATVRNQIAPASMTRLTAAALCLARSDLSSSGSTDRLLGLVSDDVVVVDTTSGAELAGRTELRERLESGVHDGVAAVDCGTGVQTDRWAATAHNQHDPGSGRAFAGITVIRVATDGIDRIVDHVEEVASATPMPPTQLVADHPALEYCRAWDGGADPDAVLDFLSTDPTLDLGGIVLVGRDAVGSYVADAFPYVGNDCDAEVVAHGGVVAARHTLRTADGSTNEALSVVRFDDDGAIGSHVVHVG